MKLLIIGAAGMIGRKLTARLVRDGKLAGKAITHAHLVDVIAPQTPPNAPFTVALDAFDIAASYAASKLVAPRPDVIFLLASVVSGEAEADFDKGYAINLGGTHAIFEAIRREQTLSGGAYKPRLIFTSSIAVYGAPFPEKIGDEFLAAPLTSYGTQKAICELLLGDYSRRGFFDGVGLRLPTICVRPGLPNKAASGFFSNILREPLAGKEAVLPVADSVRHYFASPRAAVGFFLHAATMDTSRIGPRRNLNMPGLSATVADELEALRAVAGEKTVALIRREPDETIIKIVAGWARDFDPARAKSLGFQADASFSAIINAHIEDELNGPR